MFVPLEIIVNAKNKIMFMTMDAIVTWPWGAGWLDDVL